MNLENVFRNIDSEISSILGSALDGKEISSVDALKLFEATGPSLSVITLVADELEKAGKWRNCDLRDKQKY